MKFYKAKVRVESEVELHLQAEDDGDARVAASKLALEQVYPKSEISSIELSLTSESEFAIGSIIRHKIFGIGVIKELKATTNASNSTSWRATIDFEEKGVKNIIIMPGKQVVEVYNG